eukprot:gene12740-15066_t
MESGRLLHWSRKVDGELLRNLLYHSNPAFEPRNVDRLQKLQRGVNSVPYVFWSSQAQELYVKLARVLKARQGRPVA